MPQLRRTAVCVSCALLAVGVADVARCQSVLDRPPNLSGGWIGAPGTLQFNFVHRFGVGDPPTRKVTNSPTFLLSYQLPLPLLIGFNYATSSDVTPAFPNEWEFFARYGRSGFAVQGGYNQAAESFDAELTATRKFGAVRAIAVGRVLSNGYNTDTTRYAVGAGATLRLNRWFALAGDVTSLLEKRAGEEVAWGAGLQIAIPYSPHSLSLQVTNTNTATLQGVSRGIDQVRGGFEFTIPFTLSRYFGRRAKTAAGAAAAGGGAAQGQQRLKCIPWRLLRIVSKSRLERPSSGRTMIPSFTPSPPMTSRGIPVRSSPARRGRTRSRSRGNTPSTARRIRS